MSLPRLIVWESKELWAPRLRRALGSDALPIRSVRTAEECLEQLAAAPASLVAAEWRADSEARLWELLRRIERQFPAARSAVVVESTMLNDAAANGSPTNAADRAFEAGARWFIMTSRQLPRVARLVRRHWALASSAQAQGAADATWFAPPLSANESSVPAILDELFENLTQTGDDRPRQHSIERLTARLPRAADERFLRKH